MAFRVGYILSTIVHFEIFHNKIFKNDASGKIYVYIVFFFFEELNPITLSLYIFKAGICQNRSFGKVCF